MGRWMAQIGAFPIFVNAPSASVASQSLATNPHIFCVARRIEVSVEAMPSIWRMQSRAAREPPAPPSTRSARKARARSVGQPERPRPGAFVDGWIYG